jgi:phosphate transport system substrate-binding protein
MDSSPSELGMTHRAYALLVALTLTACGGGDRSASDTGAARQSSSSVDLTGAGATFPYPLYSKWFSDYAAKTGVRINYQSIGSGGGIRQLSEGTVDFGASDSPMTDEEMARAKYGPILHVPMVIGEVALTYNLPEAAQPLKLSGDVIGDIFLGKITKWNDPRLAALNAGVNLPARDILVVHRSDGSGTTYIFTDYLASVNKTWAAGPGKGKEVQWPVGLGGKGNEGVAGQIKQTPGSIGYTELAYAKQNRLTVGAIKNAAGEFVLPSVESATAAAAGAADRLAAHPDFRVSIVNAAGAGAYPISSYTWILVYETQRDAVKGKKLTDFLEWAITEGEKEAAALDYSPLPPEVISKLSDHITRIKPGAGT